MSRWPACWRRSWCSRRWRRWSCATGAATQWCGSSCSGCSSPCCWSLVAQRVRPGSRCRRPRDPAAAQLRSHPGVDSRGGARHGLFDVRVVLSRVIVYGVLTAGVVLDLLRARGAPQRRADLRRRTDASLHWPSALAFNPLRLRLQRRVEVAMYGARRDPIKAASAVGQRLAGDDLPAIWRPSANAATALCLPR